MATAFGYVERLLAFVWHHHFRVPKFAYWSLVVVGFLGVPFASSPAAIAGSLAIAGLGVAGVARWKWHQTRALLLVVARPADLARSSDRARRAQVLLIEQLQERLTSSEFSMVHAIPVTLGPTDVRVGDQIRRRLGAWAVLVGRIDERADGGWTSHVALIEQPDTSLTHIDPHTRDRLPNRTVWRAALSRLSPTRDVQDFTEPLVYGTEIEAFIRGFEGRLATEFGDQERAIRCLRDAIERSVNSNVPAIDVLRCSLADALSRSGQHAEAKALLLRRRSQGGASPELLRRLATFDAFHGVPELEHDIGEAIEALEEAASSRADPKRPTTLFNLSSLLAQVDPARAEDLLLEAMAASDTYADAWYAHRHLGARYWDQAEGARASGDDATASERYRAAARAYRKARRLRPRWKLTISDRQWRFVPLHVYPRSPILLANLADAQFRAGDRHWRVTWRRCQRLRKRYLKRASGHAYRGEWERAYAWWDWTVVGYDDVIDLDAQVRAAIAAWQSDDAELATQTWEEALTRNAFAYALRAAANEELGLQGELPGTGPETVAEAIELLEGRAKTSGAP